MLSGRSLSEIEAGLPARAGSAGGLEGAREAPMPTSIEPMLATLIEKPFSDPDWLFELKWDGMRVLAFVRDGALNCDRAGAESSRRSFRNSGCCPQSSQ